MKTEAPVKRARNEPPSPRRSDRLLGHPGAFLATAGILFALFGWTFVANPDRVAPTKDPAYYTWRTEAIISEDPVTLLEVEGAFDMFAGGYRVAAPVLGGLLRQVAGVGSFKTTVIIMVVTPVAIALLLGGFAYRYRRDPLAFHSVALASGSLLLTPPFVGYLDNVLCLMFLAAALFFIEPARVSWGARTALALLLLGAGLTHPTTLVIFGLTLGAMAGARLLFRRFDLRSVLRDDGPMLGTAFVSAVVVYLIWSVGVWGQSASLAEAALPPPYGSDFFLGRMRQWIDAMNPVLNGPLLALGITGLVVSGRRWVEDELARTSIVWLAPLAGLFGFVAGLAYPYYRFFNTTLAWILLVGMGAYFAASFFIRRARSGGVATLALVGVVAVAAVVATNFATGFEASNWNRVQSDWISADEREGLLALQSHISAATSRDTPIVFVIDDEPRLPFQIWGFTKLSGNQSRVALPLGQIDRGHLYLGDLRNLLDAEPTLRGEETYDMLSRALLEDAQEAIEASGEQPVIVVADMFNPAGANADLIAGSPLAAGPGDGRLDEEPRVWLVRGEDVAALSGEAPGSRALPSDAGGPGEWLQALLGGVVLLAPGMLAIRWMLPRAGLAESLGLVIALSVALLSAAGLVLLAVARAPLSEGLAWSTVALAVGAGALAWWAGGRGRTPSGAAERRS